MNPLNFAHPPGAFSGTAGGKSIFTGNTPFQEFPHSGSTVLPVLPDQRPKTASDPVRQRTQSVEGLGYPVIIPPTVHELL